LTAALLCSGLPALSQELPAGPGKELAEANCNICHTLLSRVGSGYTPEGWTTVLQMMHNQGAPLPADQVEPLKAYLIKAFPEKGKPTGVVIEGPAEVSFKEWQAPTPGSRPHDPLAAKDGSLWYTGQLANVLGRVDPKTGEIKEFHLKTEHSGPHGLQEDGDGNIWYTGNTGSLIGKLDPKTGAVTEYPTPESGDPHTLIFDKDGILWFTMQTLNRIGRLDPKTGEIKLLTPPTANSRPYGMALNSKGTVFFVEFGTNKVGSIDPKTMEFREYPLPDAASRPRRIAITSDDVVWYSDYFRDRQGDGVAVAERAKVRALRHLGDQRYHLVQRVRLDPEYRGALRSQDPKIPELGDSGWRQHRAQHLGDARRQLAAGQQPRQWRNAGHNQEVSRMAGQPRRAHKRWARRLAVRENVSLRRAP
jgi:virginiamycin B lyase